ncbi:MAG: hypothetical protein QOG34_1908, partial [Frankiaceae bacterium]|nr:hypothetical protein [Frankiaceae bacterium]
MAEVTDELAEPVRRIPTDTDQP